MLEPKVVIILLNYNQLNNIIECLASLKEVRYQNYEIILVDNCSTDNSWIILEENYPYLKRFKTEKNSGYTGGINYGFKKALEQNPDYILVLNPDTIVTENFLTALVLGMEKHPKAAAAGGLILAEHNRETIWFAGGKLIPWRGLAIHFNRKKSIKKYSSGRTEYVNFLTGCMVLFRANIMEYIGTENEKFFLYLEDIEFSARIIKKGYKLLYVSESIIYHKVIGEYDNILKLYYSVRNRLLLINLMNKGINKIISNIYFMLVINCKLLYWSVSKRNFYRAASKGLKDYFSDNFYEGHGLKEFYKSTS